MVNTTGTIVGRLSKRELCDIIISCDDKEIRRKFVHLLNRFPSEDLVISEPN